MDRKYIEQNVYSGITGDFFSLCSFVFFTINICYLKKGIKKHLQNNIYT